MVDSAVLVVDDDPAIRELLWVMLEALPGVCPVLAANGEEGVRLAREAKPALVLLDLAMPGVSGLDVVTRLKADPGTEAIPVIAVTAMITVRKEALAMGCAEFVQKPFSLDYLVATVRRYLPAQTQSAGWSEPADQ